SAIILGLIVLGRRVRRIRERANAEGAREQRESHRRFLSRLDHELKNPLTAIRAALAADGVGADVSQSPHQAVIESQTRRLGELVADLRKLAELETVPIENEPVDLEQLATEVVDAIRDE